MANVNHIFIALIYVVLIFVLFYVYYQWLKKNGPNWFIDGDEPDEDVNKNVPT